MRCVRSEIMESKWIVTKKHTHTFTETERLRTRIGEQREISNEASDIAELDLKRLLFNELAFVALKFL